MKSLDAFAKKCLTSKELNYFNDLEDSKKPIYLAKQFSIKEAISKAFGTGIRQEASCLMPVPNAFEIASFIENCLARYIGFFESSRSLK